MRSISRTVAAAVATGAIVASAAPAGAIVGGSPDGGEHPYVGELLFYVPDEVDPRFDDPGAWFTCTGTVVDEDTVVTAGHCTYGVGTDGEVPADPLEGGNDVWFSVAEAPDFGILPPSSGYDRDENPQRYADWSTALDGSEDWAEVESTATHPEFVPSQFFLHDLGVLELDESTGVTEFGSLPSRGYLDRYTGKAKQQARFESVGFGLEASGPKFGLGGDTRRRAVQRLVSFKGAFGLRDVSVNFSHAAGGSTTGGTCFGDSGGPTFDISSPEIAEQNIVVAVTSFGFTSTCTSGGSYRIDQPDDLEFLAPFTS